MKSSVATLLLLCVFAKANPLYNRITGGQPAEPHAFPYQVALNLEVTPERIAFCGGSIISERTVLTAAHCFQDVKKVKVIAGAHNITAEEATQQIFVTTNFFVNEGWDLFRLHNDIAVIITDANIKFNVEVQKIVLPSADLVVADATEATVSGWGIINDGATTITPILHYVTSKIMAIEFCNMFYLGLLDDTQICLNGYLGTSACKGDSGGPLTTAVAGETVQIGLTSFGISFGCEIGFPSVYTYVPKYIDWINKNLVKHNLKL